LPSAAIDPPTTAALARKYRLRIDWTTALEPVCGLTIATRCVARAMFACSTESTATRLAHQRVLAANAPNGAATALEGTGHFPGQPPGSAAVLARALEVFAARAMSNATSMATR